MILSTKVGSADDKQSAIGESTTPRLTTPRILGRYAIYGEIAAGGMATIHVGRLRGPAGFARTVAIKRLHAQFAKDAEFVSMFLDEARLAARIRHPNVVSVIDVVATEGELFLVMDYIDGNSLSALLKEAKARGERLPLAIVVSIISGGLAGLHAAHEARDESGAPLGIVHRDVSPQNLLVGVDGTTSLLDFGVAKAARQVHITREGEFKGKLAYIAPEQLVKKAADRRTDVYAAGLVLWEMLAGRRRFSGDEASLLYDVVAGSIEPPSSHNPAIPKELDAIVLKAVARDPDARFQTAHEMAVAIERVLMPATAREVGAWVRSSGGEPLERRANAVATVEKEESSVDPRLTEAVPVQTAPVEARAIDPSDTQSGATLRAAPRRGERWARSALIAGAAAAVVVAGYLLFVGESPGATSLARPIERSVLKLRSFSIGDAEAGPKDMGTPTPTPTPSAQTAPATPPTIARPPSKRGTPTPKTDAEKYGF